MGHPPGVLWHSVISFLFVEHTKTKRMTHLTHLRCTKTDMSSKSVSCTTFQKWPPRGALYPEIVLLNVLRPFLDPLCEHGFKGVENLACVYIPSKVTRLVIYRSMCPKRVQIHCIWPGGRPLIMTKPEYPMGLRNSAKCNQLPDISVAKAGSVCFAKKIPLFLPKYLLKIPLFLPKIPLFLPRYHYSCQNRV